MSVSFQKVQTGDQYPQQAIPVVANPVLAIPIQQPTTPAEAALVSVIPVSQTTTQADRTVEITHQIGNQVITNSSNRSFRTAACAASMIIFNSLTAYLFYVGATSDNGTAAICLGSLMLGVECCFLSNCIANR